MTFNDKHTTPIVVSFVTEKRIPIISENIQTIGER